MSLDGHLLEIERKLKTEASAQEIQDFLRELMALHKEYPSHIQLLRDIGSCYLLLKDYESAERYLRWALDIDPQDIGNYSGLLVLYYRQNNEQKARSVYDLIKKNTPSNLSFLYGFGIELFLNKEVYSAKNLFEALFEIDHSPEVYHNLAVCCLAAHEKKRASQLVHEGLNKYPNNLQLNKFYQKFFNNLHVDYIICPRGEGIDVIPL